MFTAAEMKNSMAAANGNPRFIVHLHTNTRYLVYQPRLTDAIIVIFTLLSYEHPAKAGEIFLYGVISFQIFCIPHGRDIDP